MRRISTHEKRVLADRPNEIARRRREWIKMKYRPLKDNVVVQVLEAEGKTGGGLFLPDTAKEKPQQGKVIAVGTGRRLKNGEIVKVGVKKGDKILFSKYSGNEVKIEGEEYLIISERDILAVLD
jgi:chaperonin GroES